MPHHKTSEGKLFLFYTSILWPKSSASPSWHKTPDIQVKIFTRVRDPWAQICALQQRQRGERAAWDAFPPRELHSWVKYGIMTHFHKGIMTHFQLVWWYWIFCQIFNINNSWVKSSECRLFREFVHDGISKIDLMNIELDRKQPISNHPIAWWSEHFSW